MTKGISRRRSRLKRTGIAIVATLIIGISTPLLPRYESTMQGLRNARNDPGPKMKKKLNCLLAFYVCGYTFNGDCKEINLLPYLWALSALATSPFLKKSLFMLGP